ncbi:adenosine deaminase [Burkholderia multivorans]|uniref:DNA-3-methyladenine glycosylase 2 family protein n=1 Tax=Burkholderia multivorans TaxID=87883 RepID=UPI00075E04EF|nr:AlkA N-terminal domain-containing protein [Burkholderia multivorans]KVV17066.1 adenosine deaminase [Burkholderia multivorans]MCO8319277.1 helix-turn-helix domain-containing protein [Burkholderia multivorans]MCO8429055.1 helix-turn-helix domain-containing protein [Burkholderia multivorans]MCO8436899.1 helix-turn-helix domain-containing protein [Burkholderia multivorans]MCO8546677.1 helix-turn-helix domain-containing protein [Burkholderia multivorans]
MVYSRRMRLDPDICYDALLSRNRRFDGWFFVGVRTTGVYCRPVCPVKPPKARNCRYFPTAAAAEKAGFRPCMRCRPELAPGHGLLDVSGNLANAAATLIDDGFLNGRSVHALAQRVGVTERHLRRIFAAQFGVSPVEFAQTQRLLMAKRLLTDTALPVAVVASTAGFGSVRRFNDLFLQRYGLNPLRLRKSAAAGASASGDMTFPLPYRPPFAWHELMRFLAQRQIDGVEWIDAQRYVRTVDLPAPRGAGRATGWVSVSHVPHRFALAVTVSPALTPVVPTVLARVRRLFDLDSRPDVIDAHLGELADGSPGLRVPGAFDGVEIAIRAIVGEHLATTHADAVLARLAAHFGPRLDGAPPTLAHAMPAAATLAALPAAALRSIGVARDAADAIVSLAQAVAEGTLALEPMAPLDATLAALRAMPGFDERAVQYVAMRAMAWPNAFPADERLLLATPADDRPPVAPTLPRTSRWAPWRAYAALHVWRLHGDALR